MDEGQTWRVRVRFRLGSKLTIAETKREIVIAGRTATLSSSQADIPMSESDWLVINALGFETEEAGRKFGHQIKSALDVSAVATKIGVDTGLDLPTAMFGKVVVDAMAQQGTILRNNVHGVDVFPDLPNVFIANFQATDADRGP